MEIVFASPSRGPISAPAIIRDAPFVFAGGGVRPEARRRGAGSLLLREIRSLMHNLDKSMLTLAAHTESADAFLIKVGKGGQERMHKAGRNRRIRKTHSAGAP